MDSGIDNPTDADFLHLGFSERQLRILKDESTEMRRVVYHEALNQLMQVGPGYGESHDIDL